ncbi:hypothetical protein GQ457_11G013740 [Hibiscus cannabinus]
MGDTSNFQAATPSRLGLRHGGGEIVEVEGGRIVRSTGRKDRHSKVCTAKGPRDRRVRLSAHTAIQFYDVQDRLGFDRPSKAVDWLIKKAKSAIDKLAELPPCNAETLKTTASATKLPDNQEDQNAITATDNEKHYQLHNLAAGSGTRRRRTATIMGNEVKILQENSGFFPHSLVSGEIEDTLKSFIPLGASSETPSSSLQFQNYPPEFSTRASSHSQDLRLSLQSVPEPMLLHHHHHQSEPVLFSGFDGSSAGWEHHHQHPAEIGRFQRLVAWNNCGGGSGIGGFLFGNPSTPPEPPAFGQNSQFFSQRGPLQSSNTPLVRAWIEQPIPQQIPENMHQQAALSGIGFTGTGVSSGFRVPARFQGEEEEHDSIPNKLSSASHR